MNTLARTIAATVARILAPRRPSPPVAPSTRTASPLAEYWQGARVRWAGVREIVGDGLAPIPVDNLHGRPLFWLRLAWEGEEAVVVSVDVPAEADLPAAGALLMHCDIPREGALTLTALLRRLDWCGVDTGCASFLGEACATIDDR